MELARWRRSTSGRLGFRKPSSPVSLGRTDDRANGARSSVIQGAALTRATNTRSTRNTAPPHTEGRLAVRSRRYGRVRLLFLCGRDQGRKRSGSRRDRGEVESPARRRSRSSWPSSRGDRVADLVGRLPRLAAPLVPSRARGARHSRAGPPEFQEVSSRLSASRAMMTGAEKRAEISINQAVLALRSGAGVEPTERGAATPHRF
jgi:hypothetical protein